jgi:HD superfamily phosphodiesterase
MDHIHNKLLNLNGLMYTETAKKLAEERHRYLCVFLETLTDEMSLPGSLAE